MRVWSFSYVFQESELAGSGAVLETWDDMGDDGQVGPVRQWPRRGSFSEEGDLGGHGQGPIPGWTGYQDERVDSSPVVLFPPC